MAKTDAAQCGWLADSRWGLVQAQWYSQLYRRSANRQVAFMVDR